MAGMGVEFAELGAPGLCRGGHGRAVWQPALDRGATPPGPGQRVVAAGAIALRVEHFKQESNEVAVGRTEGAGMLESAARLDEVRVLPPHQTLAEQRVGPGIAGVRRDRPPRLRGPGFVPPVLARGGPDQDGI